MMKKDVTTRADIESLLMNFYGKVKKDDLIGFIFNDIAKVDWNIHLPLITDFWETIILGTNTYKGNPLKVHQHLNEIVKLEKHHFDRWLKLFNETAAEYYEGPNIQLMMQRAQGIATVLQIKMN